MSDIKYNRIDEDLQQKIISIIILFSCDSKLRDFHVQSTLCAHFI